MIFAETHVALRVAGVLRGGPARRRAAESSAAERRVAFRMVARPTSGWSPRLGRRRLRLRGQAGPPRCPRPSPSACGRRERLMGRGRAQVRAGGAPRRGSRSTLERLEQGYLRDRPRGAEVRVRRKDDETLMTVKTGIGLVRGEEEFAIDPDRFERLWPLTEGRQVVKTRYFVPLDDGLDRRGRRVRRAARRPLHGRDRVPGRGDRARVRAARRGSGARSPRTRATPTARSPSTASPTSAPAPSGGPGSR